MKTRSIKELLTILLENEELFKNKAASGLCGLTLWLKGNDEISYTEYALLMTYIEVHRPKKGKHYCLSCNKSAWHWEFGVWPPREKWLKYRIKKEAKTP